MELLALKQAEKQMKAALSNYQAADKGRRNKDWRASPGSADLMILPEALTLNARARQAIRDSWIASSMIRAAKRNIAGTGIDVVPTAADGEGDPLSGLNRRVRADFWRWASDKKFCDVEQRQNFWQKQRLAVGERYATGEHFTVWSYSAATYNADGSVDRRRPVGLKLQSFEAEQLNLTVQSYEGREVRNGVEIDPDTSAPLAYHFYTRNPNDYLVSRLQSTRVEAARVFHYMDQDRVLQTHGVTPMASVLQEIRDFDSFKQATLWRARMEACIGMVVKTSATSGAGGPLGVTRAAGESTTTATGMTNIDFVPGMTPHLAEGEDVAPYIPSSPGNQYDPFTTITLRGIGAGAGMSYDQISRHADGNYSAARQNMLEDWREWEIEQENLISDLIMPVYTLWFHLSVLEGRFDNEAEFAADEYIADPHRFTEAACVAPARPWIDPEKEANGYKALIDYRLITREEINAGRGKRFAEQIRKIGAERKEAKGEGVVFPEDVAQQLQVADAHDKTATGDLKDSQAKVLERAPLAPPTLGPAPKEQFPPSLPPAPPKKSLAALIPADVPDYRDAVSPEVSCGACRFFLSGKCQAYDFSTDPTHVCGAFETAPVSEGASAKILGQPPVEGDRVIDDPRGDFTDRNARGLS